MKKTFFVIATTLWLTSCVNFSKSEQTSVSDSLPSELANNEGRTGLEDEEMPYEERQSDETEELGLAPYQEEKFPISELPSNAEEKDRQGKLALYVVTVNAPTEDEPEGIYSVWMTDEQAGTARRILLTNPTASGLWDEMEGKNADAAPTEMQLIATAEKAYFASKDGKKIIVEGCPDGRNFWTYIIDTEKRTFKQFPSTEGVQEINLDKGEVILASYGYFPAPDYGRYTVNKAYSLEGKFLRQTSEPEAE